jgi:hypothetical protein
LRQRKSAQREAPDLQKTTPCYPVAKPIFLTRDRNHSSQPVWLEIRRLGLGDHSGGNEKNVIRISPYN